MCHRQASRISLRLAVNGIFFDILYAIAYVISSFPTGPGPLCRWSMFFTVLFLLCSLFITAAIGLNLLVVFVFKVQKDRHVERGCYFAAGITAVVIPAVALGLGRFGWDGTECWYTFQEEVDDFDVVFAWQWATYYGWILLTVVFSTVAMGMFSVAARNPHKGGPAQDSHAQKQFDKTNRLVRKAVDRIKWYCVVPLLGHVFSFTGDMYFHFTGVNVRWTMVVANFMSTSVVSVLCFWLISLRFSGNTLDLSFFINIAELLLFF